MPSFVLLDQNTTFIIWQIELHRALPQVVFAVPSLLVGIFILALPETKGVPLTQTVEESEQFVSSNSCVLWCVYKPPKSLFDVREIILNLLRIAFFTTQNVYCTYFN